MIIKLNLGAGNTVIPGYDALDAKTGDKIYPLMVADGSVDEIRASHVLEHFPAATIGLVLRDWVRALKPGGILKIAVPDFGVVVEQYGAGADINVQGYVMGGQCNELDFHKTIFDERSLRTILEGLGLVGVRPWKSEIDDCAALPISLNLAATKPGPRPRIAAICSMPRLGFNDFWGVMLETVRPRGIEFYRSIGVFWGKKLTQGIAQILERDPPPEWILTLDYDTVFTPGQLDALIDVASRHPEADAIAPLQSSRHHKHPMLTVPTEDGTKNRAAIDRESLDEELLKIRTAHFGCTLIRVEKLLQLPKPWFMSQPDDEGAWGDGSIDEDIWFWHQWAKAGFSLHVACRVPVGHIDIAVRWPDINLETVWQTPRDFLKGGPPNDVWR